MKSTVQSKLLLIGLVVVLCLVAFMPFAVAAIVIQQKAAAPIYPVTEQAPVPVWDAPYTAFAITYCNSGLVNVTGSQWVVVQAPTSVVMFNHSWSIERLTPGQCSAHIWEVTTPTPAVYWVTSDFIGTDGTQLSAIGGFHLAVGICALDANITEWSCAP